MGKESSLIDYQDTEEQITFTVKRKKKRGPPIPSDKTAGYHSWQAMIRHCESKTQHQYPNYGGRGIKVCTRWRDSFEAFIQDMGPRPSKQHSIERIDNNGDYTPENCRWATPKEQLNNTRVNRRLTCNGRTETLTEWAKILGITPTTLAGRLKKMSVKKALTWKGKFRFLTHDGLTLSTVEWSKRTGIRYPTLMKRLYDGWTVADALTKPVRPWGR